MTPSQTAEKPLFNVAVIPQQQGKRQQQQQKKPSQRQQRRHNDFPAALRAAVNLDKGKRTIIWDPTSTMIHEDDAVIPALPSWDVFLIEDAAAHCNGASSSSRVLTAETTLSPMESSTSLNDDDDDEYPGSVLHLHAFASSPASSGVFTGFGAPNPRRVGFRIHQYLYRRSSVLRTFLFRRSVVKLRNFLPDRC